VGLFDRKGTRVPSIFTPRETVFGSWQDWWNEIQGSQGKLSPAKLFATQPHLRAVVSFLARNTAQLGLHLFERVGEDRRRDRTSLAARTLRTVDGSMSTYELIFALVGDLCLYDRAHWYVGPSSDTPTGWMIRRIPPSWIAPKDFDIFRVNSWQIAAGDSTVTIPAENILSFTGYSPTDPLRGSPTVEALRQTLNEQLEAAAYRGQVWKRGGRVSAVIERPADAPDWGKAARKQFREDWYAKFTGNGPGSGGTPILEDGMTLRRIDFNAQEQQFVEAAKLSMVTVAAAFHVNPTMVGQNDGANYSNVREFRRMLYGDTLGPLLAQIEDRLNGFLLPMLGMDPERFYFEFNIAEKLQGSFEEQTTALQSAVGAPWMTRAEARARMNLPTIPEADGLVVPLNVLIGGQASPTDSAPKAALVQHKAASPAQREKVAEVLAAFFARQGKAVLTRIGSGADWWDEGRWNSELAKDLFKVAHTLAELVGSAEAKRLGFPDGYSPDRTVEFLTTVTARYASNINLTTKSQLDAALASEGDPAKVFEDAKTTRAPGAAVGISTFIAAFGVHEAAAQITHDEGGTASKTWIAGANPRPTHARMNGETVGLDETFSNGAMWPGDSPDVDEVAGCNCSLQIDIS
jgi:HK97 family phage portal protein